MTKLLYDNMGSLLLNPHYCPEDKDVFDFINSITVSQSELVKFLRKRGTYVSADATKKKLAEIISMEVFVWEDVIELLSLSSSRATKKKFIPGSQKTEASFDLVKEAIDLTSGKRLSKHGEKITCTKVGEDTYRVLIEHKKIHHEKSRLIQVVEQESELIIKKSSDGFKTSRTSGKTAHAVEMAIIGELEISAKDEGHVVEDKTLKMSALVSIEQKVRFFAFLSENIEGFDFEEIKVARIQSAKDTKSSSFNDEDEDEDEDENEEKGKESKDLKSIIESLVIQGSNVGQNPIYAQFVGKDFYPMSVSWRVIGDGDIAGAEIKAAFIPSGSDHILEYSVNKIKKRRSEKEEPWLNPSAKQEEHFANLLARCSENAFEQLTKEAKKEETDES